MKRVNLGKKFRHYVDTETTGLDDEQDELLEVAIVTEEVHPEDPYRAMPPTFWAQKIKPVNPVPPEAARINGYTPELWADSVPFTVDLARTIGDKLKGGILIGHSISFDIGFLTSAFRRVGAKPKFSHRNIDTIALAYDRWGIEGDIDQLSLDYLRTFLGIPPCTPHNALTDAMDCRTVFHEIHRPNVRGTLNRWRNHLISKVRDELSYLGFCD